MFLQSTLAQTLGDTVAQSQVAVQIAEETADKMNLLTMAMKGGWIMIVLLILSIICFYIFFNRISVYRKAVIKDPHFLDRVNDYMKNGEIKSAQIMMVLYLVQVYIQILKSIVYYIIIVVKNIL